jgi:hypothetical protein
VINGAVQDITPLAFIVNQAGAQLIPYTKVSLSKSSKFADTS